MKRSVLLALAALLLASLGILGAAGVTTRDDGGVVSANSCSSWVNSTAQRVAQARLLVEPPERAGNAAVAASTAAQEIYQLAQQQVQSSPPNGAQDLNGDLVEAMGAAAAGLAGTGGAAPETQLAFAKAIIYNAGVRLTVLNQTC